MQKAHIKLFVKWLTIGFIIAFLLPSCALFQSKTKRAERAIRKAERLAPELFAERVTRDTIYLDVPPLIVKDTIITDSTITVVDTITNVQIKYRISSDCDTIEIEADCPDNETITEYRDKIVKVRDPFIKRAIPWFLLGLLLAIFILFNRQKKR